MVLGFRQTDSSRTVFEAVHSAADSNGSVILSAVINACMTVRSNARHSKIEFRHVVISQQTQLFYEHPSPDRDSAGPFQKPAVGVNAQHRSLFY